MSQPEVRLWAQNQNIAITPAAFVVPGSWLSPVATEVPPGWNLPANTASAQRTHADDQGSQVMLQGRASDTATFIRLSSGVYLAAPPRDPDYLSVDGNGHL